MGTLFELAGRWLRALSAKWNDESYFAPIAAHNFPNVWR
jgi:hypothetical protein